MLSSPQELTTHASLAGKSALVTGSTSGIGLGIAERLAAAGARVLLNGFGDPAEIEEIRSRLAADVSGSMFDITVMRTSLRPTRSINWSRLRTTRSEAWISW